MDNMGLWLFFQVSSSHKTAIDWFLPAIGLLPRAHLHPHGCNSWHDRLWYYNPNKLSGEFRVPRPIRLTVWSSTIMRSGPLFYWWAPTSMWLGLNAEFPSFLDLCLYRRRCQCTVNCASFVRVTCIVIPLLEQGSWGSLVESPFGTRPKSLSWSQWVYGRQMSHSSSIVRISYSPCME